MARYIDADRLKTKIHELYVQPNIELWQVVNCVANSPTADVVLKSEVEEAIRKVVDATDKVICEAEVEVAREIFMDIDRVVEKYSMGDIEYPAFVDIIAKFKKKYTEDKE